MSEEISKIARVYQFLSDYGEQWKDAADQCGYADGIVTKAEFRTFMFNNFTWENEDTDAAKKDLVNQFWATIDTNRSGRIAGSSKSNLDALDKDEVNKMQEKIEIYDAAIAFADTLSLPEGSSVNDYSAWRKKVKESILARVETYIKNGGKLENLQEFLEAQGQEAVVITTADMIAQDLIKDKTCTLKNAISARDDIMMYLIHHGVDALKSFKTMESVRKGKGIKAEVVDDLKKHNVEDWYINSCQKIKYLFPRAHTVTYVLNSIKMAWYKLYYPAAFYEVWFSVRGDSLEKTDLSMNIVQLRKLILSTRTELQSFPAENEYIFFDSSYEKRSQLEQRMITLLLLLEMKLRGYELPDDIVQS